MGTVDATFSVRTGSSHPPVTKQRARGSDVTFDDPNPDATMTFSPGFESDPDYDPADANQIPGECSLTAALERRLLRGATPPGRFVADEDFAPEVRPGDSS